MPLLFSPDCDPGLFVFDPYRVVAMPLLFSPDCDPGLFVFDPCRGVAKGVPRCSPIVSAERRANTPEDTLAEKGRG
jgi:hypothetical protein